MKRLLIVSTLLAMTLSTFGQALMSLGDLNPGSGNSIPSGTFANTSYEPGIFVNEKLIFSGYDTIHGLELFSYDGEEIDLIKDIRPGNGNSNPIHYHELNDLLLFIAYDTTHGYEWWRTDGTEEGTALVKDIFPGKPSGVTIDESASFLVVNDHLYFAGISEEGNDELWRTDGTAEGTSLVKNIAQDFPSFNQSSYPTNLHNFGDKIVFNTVDDGFWISDGTEEGTVQLSESNFSNFASLDSIFIYQSSGLWRSDGTPEGTEKYTEVNSSSYYNYPGNRFAKTNELVVFPSRDEEHGDELWRTDGTAEGTFMVKDLITGSEGYPPQNLINVMDKVYYRGKSSEDGTELFRTDGTAEGTEVAVNFLSGSSSGLAAFSQIIPGEDFIAVYRGNSPTLHLTQGSNYSLETVSLPGDLFHPPKNFYAFGNMLLFYAYSEETGYEPYLLDVMRLFDPADEDMDGYAENVDCDDSNASVNPDQEEIPYNGIDDDCNAATLDDDLDQDGFTNDIDCNDEDAGINPDAEEIADNGIDENCDGVDAMTSSLEFLLVSGQVYPNPATDILHLPKNKGVRVFDVQGMHRLSANEGTVELDISALNAGIYFLHITVGREIAIVRFTKI